MLSFEERIAIAAKTLNISEEDATKYSYLPENCDGIFVSVPEKGGGSVIVDPNGGFLFLSSFYGYDDCIEKYLAGERTNPDK